MTIAIIIKDSSNTFVGHCLGDAKSFLLINTISGDRRFLNPPKYEHDEIRSKVYSDYLSKQNVEILYARDLGPKAKSYLDEVGIKYKNSLTYKEIEQTIALIFKR